MKIEKEKIREIILLGGREKTTAQKIIEGLQEKPNYLINAGMFDRNTGLTVCDTIVDGILINGGNYTNKGFILKGMLEAATTEQALAEGATYFLGGNPTLVWDGKIDIDKKGFTDWFLDHAKAYRIGIGTDKEGNIIVDYPKEKMTVADFAKRMLNLGCVYAINLDGGGSCRAIEYSGDREEVLNTPTENRAVSTWIGIYVKEKEGEEKRNMKVCIDAGHAKNTVGKQSFDGRLKEYEFNRDVAKRLKYHLERHGIMCFYSCDLALAEDTSIEKRVRVANEGDADYLISIHANAYGNDWNTAQGWESYVCAKGGNAEKLAESIRKKSMELLGRKDRGVKVKKFEILQDTKMPAVLIEHGFYTNKSEMEVLIDEDFREKCALADCKGILEYLDIVWKDETSVSDWAKEAWAWAKEKNVCDGTRPNDFVTREEIITILYRYQKQETTA